MCKLKSAAKLSVPLTACRVAAVSKDRLNDELLLVVLSDSQRIGADRIVDERAKVMDMCGDPLA